MDDVTALMDLARTVSRELSRLERDEVCCGDTTFQQFTTLRTLHEAGAPMTTGALATHLGIDLSTASRNLAVLERNGYIRRARAADDARQVTNHLTARGSRAVSSLCCDERTVFTRVLARLAPAERPAVIAALGALARALTSGDGAAAGAGAPCCPPAALTVAKGSRR